MPDSALSPDAAVERLGETSKEVRAAILLDERGGLAAQIGTDEHRARQLQELSGDLLRAADLAGDRAGIAAVGRVEVSRPDGGVYAVREPDRDGRRWTLVAITAAGALPALMLYDLRMTVLAIGAAA